MNHGHTLIYLVNQQVKSDLISLSLRMRNQTFEGIRFGRSVATLRCGRLPFRRIEKQVKTETNMHPFVHKR